MRQLVVQDLVYLRSLQGKKRLGLIVIPLFQPGLADPESTPPSLFPLCDKSLLLKSRRKGGDCEGLEDGRVQWERQTCFSVICALKLG